MTRHLRCLAFVLLVLPALAWAGSGGTSVITMDATLCAGVTAGNYTTTGTIASPMDKTYAVLTPTGDFPQTIQPVLGFDGSMGTWKFSLTLNAGNSPYKLAVYAKDNDGNNSCTFSVTAAGGPPGGGGPPEALSLPGAVLVQGKDKGNKDKPMENTGKQGKDKADKKAPPTPVSIEITDLRVVTRGLKYVQAHFKVAPCTTKTALEAHIFGDVPTDKGVTAIHGLGKVHRIQTKGNADCAEFVVDFDATVLLPGSYAVRLVASTEPGPAGVITGITTRRRAVSIAQSVEID